MTRQSYARSIAASLVLLVLAAAPLALADRAAKKPKKGTKAAPSASASASAAPEAAPAPTPSPTPTPAPEPAPSASASSEAKETKTEAAAEEASSSSTVEEPGRKYYFVGLRYRGTLIPQFMVNLFADEGGTFYSNSVGAELDMRKDNQSMVAWIAFTEYGTGNTVFHEKGKSIVNPGDPATYLNANNYSVVNSSLKAIFLGVDELWSTPIADHLDFEFGFGVGIGVVFGSLANNWVFANPGAGNLSFSKAQNFFTACASENDSQSCQRTAHQNAQVAKVGGYTEPNWFSGGSIPVVFPHIAFPQVDLRIKPAKEFEARLGLGFSITGFWFGISGDYGLEKPKDQEPHKASHTERLRDTL